MINSIFLYAVFLLIGFSFVCSIAGMSIKTSNMDITKISASQLFHTKRHSQLTCQDLGDLKI
jgi:hypothetical protein